MSAPSRPQPRVAEISPAWRELWALACGMRPEWDAIGWQGAVVACRDSGVPFGDVAVLVWRLVWDATTTDPAELGDLAREHGRRQAHDRNGLTAEERDELRANAIGACDAALGQFRAAGHRGSDP